MSGDGGGPAFNPNTVGALSSINPTGGGMGVLGILRDATGFGINMPQGLAAKQIVQGGLCGIAGTPKPGMLSKLGLDKDSILAGLKQACSNGNIDAIRQAGYAHMEAGTPVSAGVTPQGGAPTQLEIA